MYPLNHDDLSWNFEMAGLRLLGALVGLGEAGMILLLQTLLQGDLPNGREGPFSGHLWLGGTHDPGRFTVQT